MTPAALIHLLAASLVMASALYNLRQINTLKRLQRQHLAALESARIAHQRIIADLHERLSQERVGSSCTRT